MSRYRIRRGVIAVRNGDDRWFIVDETGRQRVTAPLAEELISRIHGGGGDEDELVAALEGRYSLGQIYYAMIRLEKQGIIGSDEGQRESAADLFRAKICGRGETGYPPAPFSVLAVRIVTVGEADGSADALARLLSRSEALRIEQVADWHGQKMAPDAVHVVVTPDYLEPEVGAFGLFARQRGLRWLPAKLSGVVPWFGPLFLPGERGCVECLLDRVRGHRRLEAEQFSRKGEREPLRLSVGQTVHSFETMAGLLAVELEKMAGGGNPEVTGGVFTLDFRTLRLARHQMIARPQCPLCGTLPRKNLLSAGTVQTEPLRLQSRVKADYRDGGERVCAAVETLERYAHLVSPITGVVAQLTVLKKTPSCFGPLGRSDWIVRGTGTGMTEFLNGRLAVTGSSAGKGRSDPQARASALGEAIERYSSQCEGYEPHVRASFRALGDAAVHPYDLMGFSERQYRDREAWRQKGETGYVPDPYDEARPIDWTPAWSLTHKRWRLVPSAFVYYSYPREGGGDICRGCSNGVAAGNCLEEAIVQGFFELVERDATAMWWYHRLLKPAVDWRSFNSPFTAAVDDAMTAMGMRLEILDLTNDLGIPVFSANLFNSGEGDRLETLGLGCHRNSCIALDRAVAELGQALRAAGRDRHGKEFRNSPQSRDLFLRADPRQGLKRSSDFDEIRYDDFLPDIENAVQLLKERDLEMLIVDLTRPDVGFPVARVMVPGLSHFWPRFGCRRLFEVPGAAGWIGKEAGEDDLNPVPFFL